MTADRTPALAVASSAGVTRALAIRSSSSSVTSANFDSSGAGVDVETGASSGPAVAAVSTGAVPAAAAATINRPRLSRRVAIDIVRIAETAAVALSAIAVERTLSFHPLAVSSGISATIATGVLIGAATTAFLAKRHVYDTGRLHDLPRVEDKLALALGFSLFGFAALALAFQIASPVMLPWLVATGALAFAAISVTRQAARSMHSMMSRRGLFDTNIAVIGASQTTEQLAAYLLNNESGLRLAGVYDDRGPDRTGHFDNGRQTGTCAELIADCRAGKVDRIIIALPATAGARIAQLTASFERLPVTLEIATHLTRDLFGSSDARGARWLGPVGLVAIKKAPLNDWGGIAKAVLDYLIALALLPVLLPVFAVIAILIKRDSRGPVFFRQNRKGFNQQPFRIWKFRTMSVMEDGDTIRQATKGDARVTRVGAILRRTSLDELPQIFNVLLGQMSIVGPRPHALAHDRQWEEDLFRYAGRQQVKPGITGWAQVHGLRGEIHCLDQVKARVDYDLEYIRTWSLWLDLKILAMTAVQGFINKNAY